MKISVKQWRCLDSLIGSELNSVPSSIPWVFCDCLIVDINFYTINRNRKRKWELQDNRREKSDEGQSKNMYVMYTWTIT